MPLHESADPLKSTRLRGKYTSEVCTCEWSNMVRNPVNSPVEVGLSKYLQRVFCIQTLVDRRISEASGGQ